MDIDRNKIRFNGIGLHEPNNQLWPRDFLNPIEEYDKIISYDSKLISDSQKVIIRDIMIEAFEGLRKVNIMSLVYKYCPLDANHFDKKPFSIPAALDCYTNHDQITTLIHQTLRAMTWNKSRGHCLISTLFGTNRNFDILKEHIKWLVNANRQCRLVNIESITSTTGMIIDTKRILWLTQLDIELRQRVFSRFIFALIRYCMELMRRLFYITVSNPYYERLFYYRFDLWQKIQARKISDLISQQVLYKITCINQLQLPPTVISKMKFYPKFDDIRLICTKPKRKSNHFQRVQQLKAILNYVLENTKHYRKFNLDNLLISLRNIKNKAKAENSKLYLVRTDIKDFFQSINQDLTREIVKKSLRQHMGGDEIKLYKFHCRKIDTRTGPKKEFVKWSLNANQKNTDRVNYFKSPDTIHMGIEDEFDNEYLRPNLVNPLLRVSKNTNTAYILLKGLKQGSPFSPILSSIYIQEAFNQYLEEFIISESCELFCFVDDILFISTSEQEARKFMHKMLKGFKDFNLRMNMKKMRCNFDCNSLNENLRIDSGYVVFYKQRIGLDEFDCTYDFDYSPVELQDTFRVSPYFLRQDIRQLVSRFKISLIHLDCTLNSKETVIRNIFEKFLLFSHRIATLLIISLNTRNNQNPLFLLSLVNLVLLKVQRAIKMGIKRQLINCLLSDAEISMLSASAFATTWNLNKIRHRRSERLALVKLKKSCIARLRNQLELAKTPPPLNIFKIVTNTFGFNAFHSRIMIPSKKSLRRQRGQYSMD